MLTLGIETSCDETAAALVEKKGGSLKVLSSVVSSQVKLHSRWGGVVPNLAAREHLKNILPVLEKCFEKAGLKSSQIDLIAATNGPGLIPALLIGGSVAKTLSFLWKKPLIGIHHIEGHIYANFISDKSGKNTLEFPLLCLVVSGGHTQLVLMKRHLDYRIIGETLDDAAGEAFDKVARILGLGYPGGPIVSAEAGKYFPNAKSCPPKAKNYKLKAINYSLPRPMLKSKDFNFSFSGLKTAVLYLVKKNETRLKNKNFIQAVCHEFQQSVIDVLVEKTLKAVLKYRPKTVSLAGGVSANRELRKQLGAAIEKNFPDIKYQIPEAGYSLDNAAMIAVAGCFRRGKKKIPVDNWKKMKTEANLELR